MAEINFSNVYINQEKCHKGQTCTAAPGKSASFITGNRDLVVCLIIEAKKEEMSRGSGPRALPLERRGDVQCFLAVFPVSGVVTQAYWKTGDKPPHPRFPCG